MNRPFRKLFCPVVVLAILAGCRSEHRTARPATTVWRPVGSWSGRGDTQTDSFEIGFDQCRIRWEARHAPAREGWLHVTVNSAVSGRLLADAIDHRGNGQGVAYVGVDPHLSYLTIQSSDVDWSLTVEEPTAVVEDGPAAHPPGGEKPRP